MDGKLKLNDLLQLEKCDIEKAKIRFNVSNGKKNPIDEYKYNPEKLLEWNYWNNKPYKEGQISIGLVRMDTAKDEWLLFTVGKILDRKNVSKFYKGVEYNFKTLDKYKDLYGRVILHYHNGSQQMFRNAKGLIDELVVKEILPTKYTGFEFPGYENVRLSFKDLETIINGNYPSYKNALKNQKAVYLITDKLNGKLYVGKATGEDRLLQRWRDYIKTGHGKNKDLKKIFSKKGFEYIKNNFQYSILENYNSNVDDDYILERESYWKEVLKSRDHGYNCN